MSTGMWLLLLLVIPVAGAVWGFVRHNSITIQESLGGVLLAFIVAFAVLSLSKWGKTQDVEIWSGYAISAEHTPQWVDEHWETYTVTKSSGSGKNRRTWTETRRRRVKTTHPATWSVETTLGKESITPDAWDYFAKEHGVRKELGYRPDYDSGDRYDYFVNWETDAKYPRYPVHAERMWTNKLRYSESIMRLPHVSEEDARRMGLYEYPYPENLFHSKRLLGNTGLSLTEWDKMNGWLGPRKQVNLILINFGPGSSMDKAVSQKAYWAGGKKNDIVVCVGGTPGQIPEWSYVFGWSESELVKQDLQSLFLDNPLTDERIPEMKAIVEEEFNRFNWHQFDYLDVPIPTWGIVTAILLTAAVQVGFYFWAAGNEFTKGGSSYSPPRRSGGGLVKRVRRFR